MIFFGFEISRSLGHSHYFVHYSDTTLPTHASSDTNQYLLS